ncbi:MAG: ATP synthase F1 subunit epsilon [Flavobacteriales bacterium]|nr:ATP synthase F1 subunit epsilon [Flavobacteriales bacterium]|tara:strand:- start:565 stop:810 length:246 start_codon:yes stop_codon:yes gene_type:complete
MFLQVISPSKTIFEGEVLSVKVPGEEGEFEMLNKHAAIVSSLNKGTIRIIKEDKKIDKIQIRSGVVEMQKNKIILLIEESE